MPVDISGYREKNASPLWAELQKIDLQQIVRRHDDITLQEWYPRVVTWTVAPNDPGATPQNLVKLFKLTQLIMETKQQFLEKAEKQVVSLQTHELARTSRLTPTPNQEVLSPLRGVSTMNLFSPGGGTRQSTMDISVSELQNKEIKGLHDDLSDMTRQVTELQGELNAAEEQVEVERASAAQLRDDLRAERVRAKDLEQLVESLNATVRDLKAAQIRTLGRRAEEEYRTELREKTQQITRYLSEIQILSAQNSDLNGEVASLTSELEAVVSELDRHTAENEELKKAMVQLEERLGSAEALREDFEQQIKDLSNEIVKRDAEDQTEHLQEELSLTKRKLSDLQTVFDTKHEVIENLQAEIQVLKADSSHAIIEELRRELADRDQEINDLKAQLAESFRDFELLSLDWHKEMSHRKETPTQPEQGLASKQVLAMIEGRNISLAEKNEKLMAQTHQFEKQLILKDREIRDLTLEVDRLYKEGAAEYARREVLELRQQRKLRDEDIDRLKQQVNELQALADDYAEENEEFRLKYNLGTRLPGDRVHLQRKRQTEIGRLQAVNATLLEEIDQLEKERIDLKKQVRLQALERGERALKLGLTVDQLHTLEVLAERMRANEYITCTCKLGDIQMENDELRAMVNSLEREVLEGQEQVGTALSQAQAQVRAQVKRVQIEHAASSETMESKGQVSTERLEVKSPASEVPKPIADEAAVLSPEGREVGRLVLFDRETMTDPLQKSTVNRGTQTSKDAVKVTSSAEERFPEDKSIMCEIDALSLPQELIAFPDAATLAAVCHFLMDTAEAANFSFVLSKPLPSIVEDLKCNYSQVCDQIKRLEADTVGLKARHRRTVERLMNTESELADCRMESDELRTAVAVIDSGHEDSMAVQLSRMARAYATQAVELRQMKRKNMLLRSWYEAAIASRNADSSTFNDEKEKLMKEASRLKKLLEDADRERARLANQVQESVPIRQYDDLEHRLAVEVSRCNDLEISTADLAVAELQIFDLNSERARQEESIRSLEQKNESLTAKVEVYRSQVNKMMRLDAPDIQRQMQELQSSLAEIQSQLSVSRSKCDLIVLERDSLQRMSASQQEMISGLQVKYEEVERQNSAIIDALNAQRNHLQAEIRRTATKDSHPETTSDDRMEAWIDLDELRQQLEKELQRGKRLDHNVRRLRQLLADLQMQSDQIFLLGQAHQQVADLSGSLASAKSRIQQLEVESRNIELKLGERDQLVERLEGSNTRVRTALLLERQEHRLIAASMKFRLAQSISRQQYTRVKDSLDIAMQYIRKLTASNVPNTGNDESALSQVTQIRVENMRLTRQVEEMNNVVELKSRELERTHRTLVETEQNYFEMIELQEKNRVEHLQAQIMLQDEVQGLKNKLIQMSDQNAMAERCQRAELDIIRLNHSCSAKDEEISGLRSRIEKLEMDNRRLDSHLVQFQLYGSESLGLPLSNITVEDSANETISLAFSQSLVSGLQLQLHQKNDLVEYYEVLVANIQQKLKDQSVCFHKDNEMLRNQVFDLQHQLSAQSIQSKRMVSDVPWGSLRSVQQGDDDDNGAALANHAQQNQIDHLSSLVVSKDDRIADLQREIKEAAIKHEKSLSETKATQTELNAQIQTMKTEVTDLNQILADSVPRKEYMLLQESLNEQKKIIAGGKDTENGLRNSINEMKQEMVAMATRQMQMQIIQKRHEIAEKAPRICESCNNLKAQLEEIDSKYLKALNLRDAQIRRLEKKIVVLEKSEIKLKEHRVPPVTEAREFHDLQRVNAELHREMDDGKLRAQKWEARAKDLRSKLMSAQQELQELRNKQQERVEAASPKPSMAEYEALKEEFGDLKVELATVERESGRSAAQNQKLQAMLENAQKATEQAVRERQGFEASVTALKHAIVRAQREERKARRVADLELGRTKELEAQLSVAKKQLLVAQQQARIGRVMSPRRPRTTEPDQSARQLQEDMEDLKANYEQSVELNVVYEDELRRLGVDVESMQREYLSTATSAMHQPTAEKASPSHAV